ncbi:MAG: D-alanyl-D-alanine carboxypeptidase family protein [Catenulispora sp.]
MEQRDQGSEPGVTARSAAEPSDPLAQTAALAPTVDEDEVTEPLAAQSADESADPGAGTAAPEPAPGEGEGEVTEPLEAPPAAESSDPLAETAALAPASGEGEGEATEPLAATPAAESSDPLAETTALAPAVDEATEPLAAQAAAESSDPLAQTTALVPTSGEATEPLASPPTAESSDPPAETTAPAPTSGEVTEPLAATPTADRSDPLAQTAVRRRGTAAAHDIGLAAAEAAAQAEAGDRPGGFGPNSGGGYADPIGAPTAPARGPRRWLVVTGVAISALALAGTATAIATRGSHRAAGDTTENTAAARTGDSSTLSDTSQPATSSSSTSSPSSSSSSPSLPPTSAPTSTSRATTPSRPTTPKSSSPTQPAGTNEEDCENTSHSTPQDEAMKFSGMTKGTQHAFLAAQTAAKAAGLPFVLNSGYRSAAYQQRIFQCWVTALGSTQAARKYALPPSESAHVMGYAMDIAPPPSAAWLESTKGEFGLCRRYADEPWHFEYQAAYKTRGCPALLAHP